MFDAVIDFSKFGAVSSEAKVKGHTGIPVANFYQDGETTEMMFGNNEITVSVPHDAGVPLNGKKIKNAKMVKELKVTLIQGDKKVGEATLYDAYISAVNLPMGAMSVGMGMEDGPKLEGTNDKDAYNQDVKAGHNTVPVTICYKYVTYKNQITGGVEINTKPENE